MSRDATGKQACSHSSALKGGKPAGKERKGEEEAELGSE